MWIHEKDQVLIKDKVFTVKSIFGLYSTSLVGITVEAEDGEKITYELLEFNKLVDEGFITPYKIAPKKTRSY